MNMQPLQARFATQEQAESVMRKLASLRSDYFRLERVGTQGDIAFPATDYSQAVDGLTASAFAGSAFQSSSGIMASADAAAHEYGVSMDNGPSTEFTLSANVPDGSFQQARNVILQAGGQVL